ncbi:hypothetical protein CKAN_01492800 [Cinnamomum micranthum f. kanehirae]|uniref:Uncharacterized protein n=1 Tax=Cinnamomum micranthum f. kanehirae TaxID=337451 RepID=A0A443P5M8_9MAGN|nr:hypothetical protein CKAN_01492800 [Cinnamomum micranthum f. kanehirae]
MAHMVLQVQTIKNLPSEHWSPTPQDVHKLNIDGSFNHANGFAGIVGRRDPPQPSWPSLLPRSLTHPWRPNSKLYSEAYNYVLKGVSQTS